MNKNIINSDLNNKLYEYSKNNNINLFTFEEILYFINFSLSEEDSIQLGNNYVWLFIKWEQVLLFNNILNIGILKNILDYLINNDLLKKTTK